MNRGLGPFSIEQGRELVSLFELPIDIHTAVHLSETQSSMKHRLGLGRSQIILFKQTPVYGHFIALVPRPKSVEVFDPAASPGGPEGFLRNKSELNGAPGWLASFLTELRDEGAKLSYNVRGPQSPTTETCLLYCVLRSIFADLAPSDFEKKARGIFAATFGGGYGESL